MRFKAWQPKNGQRRRRKVFAWLPTQIGDVRLWLESYIVVEEFNEVIGTGGWIEIERELP